MILTRKAKKDFYKFLIEKYPLNENNAEKWFLALYDEFKNALIIEWFDSVGIYINVELDYLHIVWFPSIDNNWDFEEVEFKTRKEATEQAIKKVNEIYNMEIPKEEPKQDIIMELEKDPSLKEFDNRVSKNLHIIKNKQESLTNDTDSHSWGFENFEVIKTEEDAKIFVETIENIPEPNDKLKKAFRYFNKQETREYDLLQHIKFCLECKNDSQAIRLIEKYGFEKQEGRYSLDELRLWLIERDVYLHNYYTTYKKSGIPMESVDKYIEDSHEYLMGRKQFKK